MPPLGVIGTSPIRTVCLEWLVAASTLVPTDGIEVDPAKERSADRIRMFKVIRSIRAAFYTQFPPVHSGKQFMCGASQVLGYEDLDNASRSTDVIRIYD